METGEWNSQKKEEYSSKKKSQESNNPTFFYRNTFTPSNGWLSMTKKSASDCHLWQGKFEVRKKNLGKYNIIHQFTMREMLSQSRLENSPSRGCRGCDELLPHVLFKIALLHYMYALAIRLSLSSLLVSVNHLEPIHGLPIKSNK